tara:strand:- start:3619 stop:5505 length:1887 start_codon:yes stop_codon:yes gene_type:complete
MGFLSSLFGVGSSSKPATTTNVVQQQLPKEISPFVTEIAKEAQDLFKERVAEGYTPYTGQTIAPLTPQEEAAMAGIEGLVGTSRPLQEEALGVTRQQAERFTPETAQAYMSPYQRAVTDIEKREAGRQFDVAQQVRDAQATGAGASSLMGTRAAILEAEAQRNQQQLLADIEAKGLQSAYQDAQRAFETQKARERQMAGDIAKTGPAMLASGIQEQGALQRIGEERRALGQSALDEAYFKFLEERQFPEQTLADYSGFIYGNPMAKLTNQTTTGTSTPFQPSLGQTLLGIGSTLGAAALRNPNITSRVFGKSGGQIDRNSGLSGLPMFRRQAGTQVVSDEELEMIDQEGRPDISEVADTEGTTSNNLADVTSVKDALTAIKAGSLQFPSEESPEVVRERSKKLNKQYTDIIKNIYPEGQNAMLANALEAFGSAIISEGNFGKAFTDTFNKLEQAGVKRRDARRIALGKVGIENLTRSEKVEEFIRNQPKRIKDALMAESKERFRREMKRREVRAKEKGKPSKRLPVDFNKRTDLLKQGKNFIQKVGINMQKSSDPNIQKAGIIIERLDDDVEKEILIEAYELNRASGDPERINEAIRKVLISKIKSGAITDEDTSWINQEDIPFVPGL